MKLEEEQKAGLCISRSDMREQRVAGKAGSKEGKAQSVEQAGRASASSAFSTAQNDREGRSGQQSGEEKVKKILEAAAPAAARLLSATVRDKEADLKQRYSAALEILNRLYGKSSGGKEGDREIEIRFSGETERYAE